MRAEPLLEPRPVPHNRLCAKEPDCLAVGCDGGLGGCVGDVEDWQVGPPPVDLVNKWTSWSHDSSYDFGIANISFVEKFELLDKFLG